MEGRKVPNLFKKNARPTFSFGMGEGRLGWEEEEGDNLAVPWAIRLSGVSNMLHSDLFPQAHLSASHRLVKKNIVHCDFGKWLHSSDSWTFIYKEHLVFLFQEMLCEALVTRLAVCIWKRAEYIAHSWLNFMTTISKRQHSNPRKVLGQSQGIITPMCTIPAKGSASHPSAACGPGFVTPLACQASFLNLKQKLAYQTSFWEQIPSFSLTPPSPIWLKIS